MLEHQPPSIASASDMHHPFGNPCPPFLWWSWAKIYDITSGGNLLLLLLLLPCASAALRKCGNSEELLRKPAIISIAHRARVRKFHGQGPRWYHTHTHTHHIVVSRTDAKQWTEIKFYEPMHKLAPFPPPSPSGSSCWQDLPRFVGNGATALRRSQIGSPYRNWVTGSQKGTG